MNVALLTGLPEGEAGDSDRESARFQPRITQTGRRNEYLGQHAHVLLPCRFLQQQLVAAGVAGQRLQVIERGYHPAMFLPAARPADTFRLLFCGKVYPRKGGMAALNAWREASLDGAEFWPLGRVAPDHQQRYREAATDTVRFLFEISRFRASLPQVSIGSIRASGARTTNPRPPKYRHSRIVKPAPHSSSRLSSGQDRRSADGQI